MLLLIKQNPYAQPLKPECAPLLTDIQALDAVLGPDVDVPPPPNTSSVADSGSQVVGDAAINAFRNTVENLVPFRGWVRRLSGADQHERDVAAAIAAGMVRRAYLKGLMQASHCLTLPASDPGYYFWRDRSTHALTRRSEWFVTKSPVVSVGSRPLSYMISFTLPRFCDQSLA